MSWWLCSKCHSRKSYSNPKKVAMIFCGCGGEYREEKNGKD